MDQIDDQCRIRELAQILLAAFRKFVIAEDRNDEVEQRNVLQEHQNTEFLRRGDNCNISRMDPVIYVEPNTGDQRRNAQRVDKIPEPLRRSVCIGNPSKDHPERILTDQSHWRLFDGGIQIGLAIRQARPIINRRNDQRAYEDHYDIAKELRIPRRRDRANYRADDIQSDDHRNIPHVIRLYQPLMNEILRRDVRLRVHQMNPVKRIDQTPENVGAGHLENVLFPDFRSRNVTLRRQEKDTADHNKKDRRGAEDHPVNKNIRPISRPNVRIDSIAICKYECVQPAHHEA